MIGSFRTRIAALVAPSLAVLVLLGGCGKDKTTKFTGVDEFTAQAAVEWFRLMLDITKNESLSPPVASRAYGYVGTALYESVQPGITGHKSLVNQLNDLTQVPTAAANTEYHWPTVANSALATIAERLFSGKVSQESMQAIMDLETSLGDQFGSSISQALHDRSVAFGESVGDAIADWAEADGYDQNEGCDYTPPVGEGLWIPTPPGFKPALEPCWGQMRTFVLESSSNCDPGPPPAYSEMDMSDFMIEAKEVYNTVNNLTQDQMDIALFWADDPGLTYTPPGHWISILSDLIEEHSWNLDVAAEAYARVGVAQADAFIACWWSKYEYDYIRPITCIQDLMNPEWTCPVNTPPFPEYTSGHSVQSGAASTVLTDMFGDMAFTDHTHDDRGLQARSYTSFIEAAEEAALSRLYGGIHFRSAIDLGIQQGNCIADQVDALAFTE